MLLMDEPELYARKALRSSPGQLSMFTGLEHTGTASDFREDLHPRDDDGKFRPKGVAKPGQGPTVEESPTGQRKRTVKSSAGQMPLPLGDDDVAEAKRLIQQMRGEAGPRQPLAEGEKPFTLKGGKPEPVKPTGNTVQKPLFGERKPAEMPANPPAGKATQKPLFGEDKPADKPAAPDIVAKAPDATHAQAQKPKPDWAKDPELPPNIYEAKGPENTRAWVAKRQDGKLAVGMHDDDAGKRVGELKIFNAGEEDKAKAYADSIVGKKAEPQPTAKKNAWDGRSPEDMAISPMGTHNPMWYDGHKTSGGMTMHVEAKPDGTYSAWKAFDANPELKVHVSAGKDAEMTMNNIWRGGVGVGPGTPQMEELIRKGMAKGEQKPQPPQKPADPDFSLSAKPKHTPAKIEGMGKAKQVDLFAGRGDSPGQTSFFDDIDPAAKNVGAMGESPEQATEAAKSEQPKAKEPWSGAVMEDLVHNWDSPGIQKEWKDKFTDEQRDDIKKAFRDHHQKGKDAKQLGADLVSKWGGATSDQSTEQPNAADPLTPTERSALPETLKDVNPAFPSEVERLKGMAAGRDFQIAGMSLEKAAKLAAENGHPEAMEKIRSRPSAWKDVLEQWRDAKKSSAAQKSRDTRAANWKPNEIQQGVLDKVGSGGRNFPRSQDMLMWGQNKAATQQLIDRGLLERTDNGREVSYRLLQPATNAVATPQTEWNPDALAKSAADPHAELIERAKKYAEYGENYDRNIATALHDLVSVKERGHGQAMQDRMADVLKKRLEHWAEPAAGGVDTDALAKSAVESGENAWTHVKAAGHDPIKDWTPAQRKSFMASLEKHREAAQPEPPQPSEGRAKAMAAQKERDEAGTNVKHSPAMQEAIKQVSEKLGIAPAPAADTQPKPETPAPRPLDDKIASSGGLIAKIGKQMGVKPQDMEDFISDVQLKAIQGQGGYDASKGEFSTWLGTIARNHKMTQQTRANAAKRAGVTQSLATPNESGKGSLADTVAAKETARESGDAIDLEKIRGVMGQLPDKQRQAFEAVVTGGKSVTEAAEEMGISKQAVSAYINYAKVKIKAAVGVEDERPAQAPPEPQKPAQTLAEKVAAQRASGKKAAPPKAKPKPKTMVSMSGGNYELVKQNDDGTVTVKNDQGDEFDSEPGEDFTVNGPEPSKRASTQPATPEPPAKSGPPGVSENDIPFQVAYNAHAGMSHVPEKRAKQRQAEYVAQMTADWEHMSKLADSPEKKEVLAAEFERYRNGFKDKTLAVLHAGSRVMSPMITGPARFPTASNRKRGDAYDKRISELLDFRKRAMAAIQKKLSPESGPVKSSDSNAVETLQKQLDAAQKYQEAAKEVNKIVRSHVASAERDGGPVTFKPGKTRESAIEAIKALGLSEKTASEALKGDYMGRVGIPDYSLKNNNANMRRIKQRIEELSKMKATPAKSEEYSGGVEVHEDPEAARIRIKFPGKPERDAIDKLKRAGFRWSPTEGAWQRHLNSAGRYAVNDVLKSLGHTKQEAAAPQSPPVSDDVPEMLPMSDQDDSEIQSPVSTKPFHEMSLEEFAASQKKPANDRYLQQQHEALIKAAKKRQEKTQ